MLDKIGIIGNTQGVSESNKPATKKPAMISHKLPDFKTCMVVSSLALLLVTGADVAGEARLATLLFVSVVSTEIVFLMGA